LGEIERAKSCVERALLTARKHQLLWRIPFICIAYADILWKLGQYGPAHGYLLDALSYEAHAPLLETAFAEMGIPIAMHMKDEATIAKCARPSAIELAFQSSEPASIGPTAAAFAQLYGRRKQEREAQQLLHRALQTFGSFFTGGINSWDLSIEIARQGAFDDIPAARDLLVMRTRLPCAEVAQACLSLFDALVACREGRSSNSYEYAKAAIDRFESLQWYAYADSARLLLPHPTGDTRKSRPTILPLADMRTVLTTREREVAALVLKGLTNRAIADALSVTENTIEKHVASVMNKLGIRSRHQLADAVAYTGAEQHSGNLLS
jgi:DNA-binding CsgD family transcriptional regulator